MNNLEQLREDILEQVTNYAEALSNQKTLNTAGEYDYVIDSADELLSTVERVFSDYPNNLGIDKDVYADMLAQEPTDDSYESL